MNKRVLLEPAFVLHTRPYRNTSLLVELFTERHGLVSVVARSARGPTSRYKGGLQPFSPLLVDWIGRSELKTLGNVEFSSCPSRLGGDALLCAFYLNELLLRLLHHEDAHPVLYATYQETLSILPQADKREVQLRYFELTLLE